VSRSVHAGEELWLGAGAGTPMRRNGGEHEWARRRSGHASEETQPTSGHSGKEEHR